MADMSSPLTPDFTHTFITAELRRVRAVRKWEQPTLRVGEEEEVEEGEDGEDGAREVSTAREGCKADDDDDDDIFSIPAFMIVPPLETAYVVALFIMQPREAPPPDGFAERDGPEGDDDDHDDD